MAHHVNHQLPVLLVIQKGWKAHRVEDSLLRHLASFEEASRVGHWPSTFVHLQSGHIHYGRQFLHHHIVVHCELALP